MDCTLAILKTPLTRHTFQNTNSEFSNVTLIIVSSSHITDDVIKHTSNDFASALTYGAIILDIDDLSTYVTKMSKLKIYSQFTIYIRGSLVSPKSWNLERVFSQVHYSHTDTTISRASIVDADQARYDYPHLKTSIGYSLSLAYYNIYKAYYETEIIPTKPIPSPLSLYQPPTPTTSHRSFSLPKSISTAPTPSSPSYVLMSGKRTPKKTIRKNVIPRVHSKTPSLSSLAKTPIAHEGMSLVPYTNELQKGMNVYRNLLSPEPTLDGNIPMTTFHDSSAPSPIPTFVHDNSDSKDHK